MLSLKNICKSYKTGSFSQKALDDVSIDFRKSEFVAILGPSGSGKTTLLNIIGGLDRYDSGDLIINEKSTKEFKDTEWDSYRNNCIGFIFQSYNLIPHISILSNVELGMTLSGVSASKRKKKALEVLEKVGLKDHAYKKPNQLSGGQMQRVAIARALANDPDIILADEPTGALDSKTSVQIMELIKEISKDKLVIMVTHNKELADNYANRIIELKDGRLVSDSKKLKNADKTGFQYKIKKTAMSLFTALNLSFNNIKTKKGRTILTAFASSIGIIGIALILSLSNGFDIQIDEFEKDTLSSMPIVISEQAVEISEDKMKEMQNQMSKSKESYTTKKEVYPMKSVREQLLHTNELNTEYIDYVEKIDSSLLSGVSYIRSTGLNFITKVKGVYKPLSLKMEDLVTLPIDISNDKLVLDNYDLLYGNAPKEKTDILLVLDNKNRINENVLSSFDLDTESPISFDKIIGREIKISINDDYYKEISSGIFTINSDFEKLYKSKNSITLKISGIIRGKEEKEIIVGTNSGICYSDSLVKYVISLNKNSKVVTAQKNSNYNVLTGEKFENSEAGEKAKKTILSYLGGDDTPTMINLFPKDFETKDKIIKYLDAFNKDKPTEKQIIYTDLGEMISGLSSSIMDAITVVLIAFSSISLVVSSIMIGIITYISVLERTKEIGVLRALGARKKDITRVFNAETIIIGLCSGLLGVFIAWLLTFPANKIIYNLTDLDNVAKLSAYHSVILIIVSMTLTIIGGLIPAVVASKKDPVIALRTD